MCAAEAAGAQVAHMTGDTLAAMQQFDDTRSDACFQDLADQSMRHAVAVGSDFDVVVDMHAHCLEVGDLVALGWQAQQCRRIQGRKGAGAAAG